MTDTIACAATDLKAWEIGFWKRGSFGGGADEGVLFCSGDPGVGKTHLRSVASFF